MSQKRLIPKVNVLDFKPFVDVAFWCQELNLAITVLVVYLTLTFVP